MTTVCRICHSFVCHCEESAASGHWCLLHNLPLIPSERTCWRCEAADDDRTEAAYGYSHESQNDDTGGAS